MQDKLFPSDRIDLLRLVRNERILVGKIQTRGKKRRGIRGRAKRADTEGQMTVARIIATKGRDVVTTQPHRTLKEVAEVLAARGIGAVVVADVQSTVLGILSERDIVRAIGRGGSAALGDAVSMHMTSRVITATESDSVYLTMEKMNNGRFRHMPVLKDGKLAGIVSIGDVVRYRLAEMEHEHSALREYIATA
jgi:CBS domain-containing protein